MLLCITFFAFGLNDKTYGDEKPDAFEEYMSNGEFCLSLSPLSRQKQGC